MVTLEDETTMNACTVPSARTRDISNYQRERFEKFRAAHAVAEPLIVVNCWDPASAAVISRHPDCQAVGTSSAGMAASKGCRDGEVLTAQQVVAAVTDICAVTNTPVSVDIEGGYVETAELGAFVSQLTACGAVGINIEDFHDGRILPISEAAARISAIRASSEAVGRPVFINARTDAFWQPDRFDDPLGDALLRIAAFADAGAHGVFLPGAGGPVERCTLVGASALPVNFLVTPPTSISELARDGAARISLGSAPFRAAMECVDTIAASVFMRGDATCDAMSYVDLQHALPRPQRESIDGYTPKCRSDRHD